CALCGTARPEISTLSYTTLFRSLEHLDLLLEGDVLDPVERGEGVLLGHARRVRSGVGRYVFACFLGHGAVLLPVGSSGLRQVIADRKSTRLNSSHVKISYAVFCL